MKKASLKTRLGSIFLVSIIFAVLVSGIAYGFACFCDGYVFNEDTSDAPAGVMVNVTNIYTQEVDSTNTSYDFPPFTEYQNRYKTAFDCMEGIAPIKIYADNGTHSGSYVQVVPTSSQAYANITLRPKMVSISVTPIYQFAQISEVMNYTITVTNIATETKNFTVSTDSPITAILNQTSILNLPSGNSVDVKVSLSSGSGGYFSTGLYAQTANGILDVSGRRFRRSILEEGV